MQIDVRMTGTDRVLAKLGAVPDSVRLAVGRSVMGLTHQLLDQVKANIAGEVLLGSPDGPLSRSFQMSYTDDGTVVEGKVFSDGSVKYDLILEYGGTTSPHEIRPVNAKALAFMANGRGAVASMGNIDISSMIFAMVVHHPGSRIPEFAYARRALAGMRRDIVSEITMAAVERSQMAMAAE